MKLRVARKIYRLVQQTGTIGITGYGLVASNDPDDDGWAMRHRKPTLRRAFRRQERMRRRYPMPLAR